MNKVKIYEVGPRDGLQNEKQNVPMAIKIALIEKLAGAGLTFIEAASFVSPKWVPQMADHAGVMAGIERRQGVTYAALVPNEKGMAAALENKTDEVAVFAAASEGFSQKNINCSIAESLKRFEPVIEMARQAGVPVRGYVSCVVSCPYDGATDPQKVSDIAAKLFDMGCSEISLGDTIGTATPKTIEKLLDAAFGSLLPDVLALHCHDTYGMALANIYQGLQMGIGVIDSSVAGLGGCPYAKGAAGNVATEDVVYMLHALGYETGIDQTALIDAAWFISDYLGRKPVSKVANALKPEKNA